MGGTLVAGVGNIFLGDDGFGVEVATRLAARGGLPEGVRVADFGIRAVHLAYELLDGYDNLVLIDALPRGGEPGSLYVLEAEGSDTDRLAEQVRGGDTALVDAHGFAPDSMLALLDVLGGGVRRVVVVGCEPADTSDRMGLSPPVAAAVDGAMALVDEVVQGLLQSGEPG